MTLLCRIMCWCLSILENKRGKFIQLQKDRNYQTINYIVNVTVINTDNHSYCIIMSNSTNDRDTKTQKLTKILNECQFIINIGINNKLGHLGHKPNITTTLIILLTWSKYSNLTLWLHLKGIGFLSIITTEKMFYGGFIVVYYGSYRYVITIIE